jgi:predicted glutamine amidotransferase
MCRLLAYASVDSQSVQSLLSQDEFERFRQLSTLHRDGWGYAWVSQPSAEPLQFNSVQRAVDDEQFLEHMASERGVAGIVHLRWATSGFPVCIENSHPFIEGGWHFAHNGAVAHHHRLLELISEDRRARLKGDTDSELYFQLILQRTDELHDIALGVRQAIADIRRVCGMGSLNCLLLSQTRMLAVQAQGETPAPVASLAKAVGGVDALPLGHDESYYRLRYAVRDGSLLVSSTGVGVDGWDYLGDDAIVDADLTSGSVTVTRLHDGRVEREIDLRP